MVLVAVTGPVGSGKTTVLSLLVQWGKEHLKSVDGFLALPHDRLTPKKGAQESLPADDRIGEDDRLCAA